MLALFKFTVRPGSEVSNSFRSADVPWVFLSVRRAGIGFRLFGAIVVQSAAECTVAWQLLAWGVGCQTESRFAGLLATVGP